jgi:hypothetical protein
MQGYAAERGFDLGAEVQRRGLFFQHECTGLDALTAESDNMPTHTKVKGNLKLPPTPTNTYTINRFWDSPWGNFGYLGGMEGFFQTLSHCYQTAPPQAVGLPSDPYYYPFQSSEPWPLPTNNSSATGFMVTDGPGQAFPYPGIATFQGLFVPKSDKTFKFKGGKAQVAISFAGTTTTRLELNFTDGKKPWPVPTDNIWYTPVNGNGGGLWHEGPKGGLDGSFMTGPGGSMVPHPSLKESTQFILAERIRWARQHNENPWLQIVGGDDHFYGSRRAQFLQPGDTIRSLVPFNPNSKRSDVTSVGMGDPRTLSLIGLRSSVKGKYFQPHPLYDSSLRHAQGLRTADSNAYFSGYARDPDLEFNPKAAPVDFWHAGRVSPQPPSADNNQEASRYIETHFGTMLLREPDQVPERHRLRRSAAGREAGDPQRRPETGLRHRDRRHAGRRLLQQVRRGEQFLAHVADPAQKVVLQPAVLRDQR